MQFSGLLLVKFFIFILCSAWLVKFSVNLQRCAVAAQPTQQLTYHKLRSVWWKRWRSTNPNHTDRAVLHLAVGERTSAMHYPLGEYRETACARVKFYFLAVIICYPVVAITPNFTTGQVRSGKENFV